MKVICVKTFIKLIWNEKCSKKMNILSKTSFVFEVRFWLAHLIFGCRELRTNRTICNTGFLLGTRERTRELELGKRGRKTNRRTGENTAQVNMQLGNFSKLVSRDNRGVKPLSKLHGNALSNPRKYCQARNCNRTMQVWHPPVADQLKIPSSTIEPRKDNPGFEHAARILMPSLANFEPGSRGTWEPGIQVH